MWIYGLQSSTCGPPVQARKAGGRGRQAPTFAHVAPVRPADAPSLAVPPGRTRANRGWRRWLEQLAAEAKGGGGLGRRGSAAAE